MEKSKKRALVVALLLPIFILVSVSVSHAFVNGEIQASVIILPGVATTCQPNPLITESREKIFTCYIEIENFDVSKIIPSTLRLSLVEQSVTPIQILPNSPNTIGDFDKDGIPDLKVTFNKKTVETWFSNLYMPQDFTFKINGEIDGVPNYVFTALDVVQVIKPSITFLDFFGKGGDINVIKGIDLSKATITNSQIGRSAKQDITFTKIDGNKVSLVIRKGYVGGIVEGMAPVTILRHTFNVQFKAWARYTGDNCAFTPSSSVVCDGKGDFYKRSIVGLTHESADIHFETDGVTANITAKQDGVKVFELVNVPLEDFDFDIKARQRFIVFGY